MNIKPVCWELGPDILIYLSTNHDDKYIVMWKMEWPLENLYVTGIKDGQPIWGRFEENFNDNRLTFYLFSSLEEAVNAVEEFRKSKQCSYCGFIENSALCQDCH